MLLARNLHTRWYPHRVVNIEDVPTRYIKKVITNHVGLAARIEDVGRWPFKKKKLLITCNCGWKGREDNEMLVVPEMAFVNRYLARLEMDRHVIEEAQKLGWKPK